MRIVSSTIRIINSIYPRIPVRTSKAIPKNKIKDVIESIKGKVLDAPVKKNQVIIKNIAKTGADIITERKMEFVKK
jgi:CxxC motif-containing protein